MRIDKLTTLDSPVADRVVAVTPYRDYLIIVTELGRIYRFYPEPVE